MSEAILTHLARRLARPVSPETQNIARAHLLDWLAGVAGARESEAAAMGGAISMRGWERATYGGSVIAMLPGHQASIGAAQLSPGPAVMPAALGMPSSDLPARLDAIVRGYEASLAVAMALDSHHFEHWHGEASCGTLGACAAFGSVIGFAPVEYANALGNAASVAGGLLHFQHEPDLLTGSWHIYHAVRTGRDAALHVHYGATGPQGLLEGAQGLFAAMTNEPGPLGEHGSGWLIETLAGTGAGEDTAMLEKLTEQLAAGGLASDQAERAQTIVMSDDGADALDTMLEEWTR